MPRAEPLVHKHAGSRDAQIQNLTSLLNRLKEINGQANDLATKDPNVQEPRKWMAYYRDFLDTILMVQVALGRALPETAGPESHEHEVRLQGYSRRLARLENDSSLSRERFMVFLGSMESGLQDYMRYLGGVLGRLEQ
jgi:hypothetical protein